MAAPQDERGYQASSFWGYEQDEETPELRWPLNIEVYDKMRRQDAQVMSVLRAVTLPIIRTEWRIDPNGARPEVVQLVSEDLGLPIKGQPAVTAPRSRDRFSWKEHLRLALLMLPFGHAYFEQVYRIDDQGRARLRKLGFRPQRTISQIDVDADGGLKALHQLGDPSGKKSSMGVERLVAYVLDREGGNWLGQSLLRPAYKFWLLKDRMLRVQLQSVDRNGMGFPVYTAGELPENMPVAEYQAAMQQQVDAGLAIARGVRSGETAGSSIPPSAKLELLGVTGQLPDAEAPIRYYDEQIARAVLAHFLNLGTETGSWALGSTFADFFTLSLQTFAGYIAETASQHIVEDLVDLNFGPDEPAPLVTFDEIGSRHQPTAEAIKALIDCGAIVVDEPLEIYLRTVYGLPPADNTTARTKLTTEGAPADAAPEAEEPPDPAD
ncbi:phage portal protein family protein [Glutamicibacter soli]|uniref:phage portal protein family protein n=1 Tax=Glutamicibacter soli TaxID=453836 RepID=UPI003FD1DA80